MQTIITASEARANIFRLMDQTIETHIPVTITGKRGNTIMISDEDWKSIQETIYLSSIPNMVESIIEGMKTPIEECIDIADIEW